MAMKKRSAGVVTGVPPMTPAKATSHKSKMVKGKKTASTKKRKAY